ncbi:MAG: adenine deaminase [Firmicutes bacterium]|nr:adenine deaminase [Bacillota bacterium]
MDQQIIRAALQQEPADLLLKGGKVLNVFSGTIEEKDVLIKNGRIAYVGKCDPKEAKETVDLSGKYLLPGFIDAHIHIESSHLTPKAFGRAVLKKGTCAVVADPHEIANAAGEEGLAFMLQDAAEAPIDIFFMLPSSVPATDKETAGAEINAAATAELLKKYPSFLGLGELMNVPGILFGDAEVTKKIEAAQNLLLDGHCPQLRARELAAYASAGIRTDHESVTADEAAEKLANGFTVLIREGSSAKNLEDLLPIVNDHNHSRICFCSDDINASDICRHGDILNCIQKAVAGGIDPVRAVEMATINTAKHYRLTDHGAIAPGYFADIVAVSDLETFAIETVWKNGRIFQDTEEDIAPQTLGVFTLTNHNFTFPVPQNHESNARVIRAFDGQIVTEETICPVAGIKTQDISQLYVAERYGKNGNIAYALIEGFGLTKGAIASSVAHDSHNLLILAADDGEAAFAAETIQNMGGGMCVVEKGQVKAALELPVGGLMCAEKAETIAEKEKELAIAAKELGITMKSPFMTLAFMALPVIPKLKLTDKGLFDADLFDFVPLYF